MKRLCEKLEQLMELGGTKKDITLLVISGIALVLSLLGVQPLPFNISWVAIILCGVPIILEAFIGLVTAFDKTGTLTYGTPEVVACKSLLSSLSDADLYRLAASAEQFSEHPLGKAIVTCCKKQGEALSSAADFAMIPGRGVSASVDGHHILAGNTELLTEHDVAFSAPSDAERYLAQGSTVSYVTIDGVFAGFIALSKRMMTTIHLNLTFSMTLNFVAIVLAITGILNPVVGALVHNAGSILVIINSALLLNWRKK